MNKKLILSLLILALIAVPLFAAACEEEVTPPAQQEEEEVTPPAEEEEEEANWWDKFGEPQYGGTIALPISTLATVSFDPYTGTSVDTQVGFQFPCETLFWWDWTLDRDIWPYQADFMPEEYATGLLAESWEQTDPTTLTVYLRHGIHWQNKPPVNGREFVASDVVEHFNRLMGWGDYTEPNAYQIGYFIDILDSISAPDDYTVVFTFKQSYVGGLFLLFDLGGKCIIEAPEAVEISGGTITDWQYCIGTGPWIVEDFVPGTSLTFSANPNYWGYDERHPENQLPYADTLKILALGDESTRMAALRSGQVDIVSMISSVGGVYWQQAQSLANTNPELLQAESPMGEYALLMRVDNAPFTDMRVRKALQMSINRPEIAQTYYGGTVEGIPCGQVSPTYFGWCYAYDEWPQELKDEYSYNPTLAMELLAEAAADGVFEPNDLGGFDTNVLSASAEDMQLLQVVQSFFLDIGVDMEIRTLDPGATFAACLAGDNDQLYWASQGGAAYTPATIASMRFSQSPFNFTHCNDSTYDEAFNRFNVATSLDEARQALYDMDKRLLEQHWSVYIFPPSIYSIYQPYLKGYSGELTGNGMGGLFARLWIDQAMK